MADGDNISFAGPYVFPIILTLLPVIGIAGAVAIVWLRIVAARRPRPIERDTIAALKENNELLRQLVALNRQMLEKQERP